MPKSSTDSWMPIACSSRSTGSECSGSAITLDSVISKVSSSAGTPCSRSSRGDLVGKSASASRLRRDRLTATGDARGPGRSQLPALRQHDVQHVVRAGCRSAGRLGASTNSAGETRPNSGCIQRTSASTPTISRREVDLGLVVHDELPLVDQRGPQLADQQQPLQALLRPSSGRTRRTRRCVPSLALDSATSARRITASAVVAVVGRQRTPTLAATSIVSPARG